MESLYTYGFAVNKMTRSELAPANDQAASRQDQPHAQPTRAICNSSESAFHAFLTESKSLVK